MNLIQNILYDSIYHATPILLAVLGGLFAYKANVLNIGLEGMIIMGAFSSSLTIFLTRNYYLGVLVGILATSVVGFVFSFFSITMKSNFIITGFGLNLLISAIATYILKYMSLSNINLSQIIDVNEMKIDIPIINKIPILSNVLNNHTFITYLSFLLIFVVYIVLYKTKFGVHLRVVGESEEAGNSVGLRGDRLKYVAIIIGAVLCALAGTNLSAERLALYTDNMVAGRGFIGIAAIYCGKADPVKSSIYAILFGVARALAINLSLFAGPASGLFDVIPYVMIVAVLFVLSYMESKKTKVRGFGV